jgi:hypothetical protein
MNEVEALHDRHRRIMLTQLGAMVGAGALPLASAAQNNAPTAPAAASAPAAKRVGGDVPTSLDAGFAGGGIPKGPPGIIEARGPFDLRDPMQNWFALMRTTNNLVGARTYVPMFMRVFICPQGRAGAPLYTSFGMWTWQLEKPDPAKFPNLQKNDVIQRALYTGVICDPWSFEPVKTIVNPVTGATVEVRDSLFAENWLLFSGGRGFQGVERPEFRTVDEQRAKRGTPYVRFGDDLSFNIAGISQTPGTLQPRVDGSFWGVKYAELMDPAKPLIEASYGFAGLMRARERKWLGFGDDDPTQMLFNTQGRKVHSVEAIPDIIKRVLLEKYPDRL